MPQRSGGPHLHHPDEGCLSDQCAERHQDVPGGVHRLLRNSEPRRGHSGPVRPGQGGPRCHRRFLTQRNRKRGRDRLEKRAAEKIQIQIIILRQIPTCLQAWNQDEYPIPVQRALRITASPSTMAIVCSKWADRLPSAVTTVQASERILTS